MPEVRDRLVARGITVVANSPEEATAFLKRGIETWAEVIRRVNLKL